MESYLAEERDVRESLLPFKQQNSGNEKNDSNHEISLAEDAGVTFKKGKRPFRDSFFAFLFLATLLVTCSFGIFAFTHADFDLAAKARHSKFNPVTNQCEVLEKRFHTEGFHSDSVPINLGTLLPIFALLVSFPVGILLFWLLRRHTRLAVLVSNPLMALIPVGISTFWFTWCYGVSEFCAAQTPLEAQVYIGVIWASLSAISIYRFWQTCSGNAFEASVQLFKNAADAVYENLFLLFLLPALFLGTLLLVNGFIFTSVWYALNNGKIVPEFDVMPEEAADYPVCVARLPEWFTTYFTLACFTAFWVLTIMFQLQTMVVSGTISQWYFAPTGSSTSGNIMRSLRIAFGPSFGTACNLGTVVTTLVVSLLGLLKRVTTRVVNSTGRQGLISVITRGCLSWMFQFPESHTRFAPYFATISGTSFWESSKQASSLLRRNSLSVTGSEYFVLTQRVLSGMVVSYSFFLSLGVYVALERYLSYGSLSDLLIADYCFLASIIGLAHVCVVILSSIDTVYICYAMEKDAGDISKPELCGPYTLLFPTEAVVAAPEDKVTVA